MVEKDELAEPLSTLPPVEFAFAYGSGVFQQPGLSHPAPMIDYILGVSCPVEWHSKNMKRNSHHYSSCLAYLGGKGVSLIADKVGVGVHFNAFVPWKGKTIKYGVVSLDNLLQDILTWRWLFISGRLQKPVFILIDNWDLAKVNQVNLHATLSAALLLLPNEFTEEELYTKISSLSYIGDVRMMFAEDKHKVHRIVQGSADKFHSLYRKPILHAATTGLLKLPSSFGSLGSVLVKDPSPYAVEQLVSSLPEMVLPKVSTSFRFLNMRSDFAADSSEHRSFSRALQREIGDIVRTSSMRQAFSGFLAAGAVNSLQYLLRKVGKSWSSRL